MGTDRITPLARFVEGLEPGERNTGLFWAGCRAAQDRLDPAPLMTAAEKTGLSREEAGHVLANAQAHITNARAEHESTQPNETSQPSVLRKR